MANLADLVRDMLAIIGLSNTGVNVNTRQTTRFMSANSIEAVEDFALHIPGKGDGETVPEGSPPGIYGDHNPK